MRKKVDERIRTLIENGVKQKHRSLFVIVGDKSRDQIVTLNYMLSKSVVKARPPVLWCYKEKLELSSHKRKRAKQVKSYIRKGLLDEDKVDNTLLFLESGNITYRQYKDSEKVLGNTFGMCVLQDFEALNPNLLARTIETVEGGGLIILLLRSLSSLTSLYTMVMDVHERFRTESHSQATARFNERFLLSLASCKACVVMDDELNILPISSHIRNLEPVSISEDPVGLSEKEKELKDLKDQFHDQYPVGPLIKKCCTVDQAKAVIAFLDSILDKTLRSTIALTASRGRGKSAALGLAVAGAVAAGYSNIFVTAPSPENLRTLFEFIIEGFKLIEYKEHLHYDLVRGTDQEFKKAIIQINIYKEHRQTIQYLRPNDHGKLSQVELLVIDEAAAIPLPIVKSLLGPYLVFLSSTINGYEGTGRSLSLKLFDQLQSQSQMSTQNAKGHHSGRNFKKIELNESIRYAPGDPIESWLNGLLCLDVTSYIPSLNKFPGPEECDLYYVNRDTLFSYHKESEVFLQRMMALYVASHYKNSPNDLQLMADAPSHHLFVLLGPVDESKNQLPDILCVIQVCLEGQISRKSALRSLSQGHQPHGDQIPWKFCQQFQDDVFPSLSGARIVRIAVHPNAMRLGYGSKAVELLSRYYEGQLADFNEEDNEEIEEPEVKVTEAAEKVSLLTEKIVPKANLPPLLSHLHERRPEKLHYIGVSFGLTRKLFRFWARREFIPFYIGQVPKYVTGEHTCMVLRSLDSGEIEYNQDGKYGFLTPFYHDFKQRFRRLLGTAFQSFHYKLAMSILAPKMEFKEQEQMKESSKSLLNLLSPYDLKRLDAYTNSCVDFPMILDLVPILAHEYFQEKIPVTLSPVQTSVLLCMGLQNRDIAYMKKAMKLEGEQIMSSFRKVMMKLYKYVNSIAADQIESSLPRLREVNMPPLSVSLDEDLNQAANEVREKMKAESDDELDKEYLKRFEIHDEDGELEKALQNGVKVSGSGIISVKSKKPEKRKRDRHDKSEETKKKDRSHGKKQSHKKNKN